MNATQWTAVYRDASNARAHACLSLAKSEPDAPQGYLRASLAYESHCSPGLLDSPLYDRMFAPNDRARAIRCLQSAARRNGLTVMRRTGDASRKQREYVFNRPNTLDRVRITAARKGDAVRAYAEQTGMRLDLAQACYAGVCHCNP